MADERSNLHCKSGLIMSCCGLMVSPVVLYGLCLVGSFLVFLHKRKFHLWQGNTGFCAS